MILHFLKHEKFTQQIVENFSKTGEPSHFFVFLEKDIKHGPLTNIDKSIITYLEYDAKTIINKIISIAPSAILLHAFHLEFAEIVNNLNLKVKIAWYCWGFDLYGLPLLKPKTYAPLTNSYLLKQNRLVKLGRLILKNDFIRKLYFILKPDEVDRYTIIYRALDKVDYFVTFLRKDYEIFSSHYPNSYKFIYCPFSTIDQYLGGNIELRMLFDAKNILVGNSNTPESNHLDVFNILGEELTSLNSAKIFTPLSYGEDQTYRAVVIKEGQNYLGDSFIPIIDYVERTAYIELLQSCSTGIFYHYRQQAMGNIIALIYLGARVYLSCNNPSLSFFQQENIEIFDFDKDFERYKNTRLSPRSIQENRKNLCRIFKQERVIGEINTLINTIA